MLFFFWFWFWCAVSISFPLLCVKTFQGRGNEVGVFVDGDALAFSLCLTLCKFG